MTHEIIFSSNDRNASHAYLDGLLPEPDSLWEPGTIQHQAYQDGLAMRGKYPLAECREDPNTQLGIYQVWTGPVDKILDTVKPGLSIVTSEDAMIDALTDKILARIEAKMKGAKS